MTHVPDELGRFAFVRIASLRAAQLIQGCIPRVAVGYKPTTTARREVSAGMVNEGPNEPIAAAAPRPMGPKVD